MEGDAEMGIRVAGVRKLCWGKLVKDSHLKSLLFQAFIWLFFIHIFELIVYAYLHRVHMPCTKVKANV